MTAAPKPIKPERGTALCRQHMAMVAELPCVICQRPGPSIVHHVICDRYAQSRASDWDTIPLCVAHHDATSADGVHRDKAKWAQLHGPDHGFVIYVSEQIYGKKGMKND